MAAVSRAEAAWPSAIIPLSHLIAEDFTAPLDSAMSSVTHAAPISDSARRKSASISMRLYIAYRNRSAINSSEEYLGRLREKKHVCAFGRNVSGDVFGPSPT